MAGNIVTFLVGVVCIVLGISNMRGNISSLHSYHRSRVSEEDRIPFGKQVGLGIIIVGIGIIVFSVLSSVTLYTENDIFIKLTDKLEFDELKNTLVIFNHGTKTFNKSKNNTNNQNSSSN